MKVSELVAKYSIRQPFLSSGTEKILKQVALFGSGFVMSNGSIFGEYAPFGISLVSAVSFPGVITALIGSVAGYIVFGGGVGNFRYIAAMIAVIAIRWTLNDIKKLNRHSLYCSVVCFVPTFATGLAVMSVKGFDGSEAVIYLIESLLGGAAAYFISRSIIILNGTKSLGMLLPQEVACLVLCGCIGILAMAGMTISGVSLGRIAAVLCVLFAARFGGVAGGTIAGIAVGIVMGLYSSEYYFLGSAYAFGGLIAGLFSPVGRLAESAAVVISCGIVSLQSGDISLVFATLYELLGASVLFCLLPKSTCNFLSAVFVSKAEDENCEGLRRSIIMRLDFAAKALSDVSSDVEEVSQKLSRIVTPTIDGVYRNAVDNTCQRCGMKVFCWEHREGVTMESFDYVTDKLRREGKIRAEDFRDDFRRKCCRTSEMAMSINQFYKSYLASEAAAKRIDEVRTVVAGQFCGLGDILGEMADEYENYEVFDNEISDRIFMKLKELGMVPIDVSCHIDYMGRMTVETEINDGDRKKIKRALLVYEIGKICGRRFDTPSVTAAFGRCRIVMCERPGLDVEIASSQHVCGSGQLCGDNLRYFNDGMGRMITVLSDGMGTGGRAAVDGGMAVSIMSKLIKAGLGFDCSLKVVNSALLVKSDDESLATLDVVSVDLYSGLTDFMKAGAALSFIRKENDMYRVETPSLPVGILPDVEFTYTEDTLEPDDIIVMVSDGATATGEQWIERIIEKWEDKSMQELADHINDEATARRNDGHDDDITVIAVFF
ncbi:MAG: SpoIIE family protein phosphatase [Clostridia bacterium]|nr:SpoIIE family protein phosphatase [Clostridia bacterium]